ncbi:hypothetical protein EVAR_60290_1 [Eumeta japonica]|uniref:Uncharacterized protein n=1 Tax=Eumeta variegata TaxID=151549 RepID=A0A4C1Z3M3_EUMVA|nr:hypothetical protein EVAR_60290_1 [Eumeta japonica]
MRAHKPSLSRSGRLQRLPHMIQCLPSQSRKSHQYVAGFMDGNRLSDGEESEVMEELWGRWSGKCNNEEVGYRDSHLQEEKKKRELLL